MFKTILTTILKPALYALVPIIAGMLIRFIQHSMTFTPGGAVEVQIWQLAILPLLAGLVKLLIRLKTWDPTRVGK